MYGKIFESIYDGSLYGNFEAIVTFQALIVLADEDGLIDISPQALAGRTSYPVEVIKTGLKTLQQSDPHSRSQDEDGKRIVPLDNGREFGWRIVNYDYYRNLARRSDKRHAATERQRRKREKDSQDIDSKGCHAPVTPVSRMSRHTDTYTSHSPSESAQDADAVIWNTGVELLGDKKSDRSLIGKWVSEHGKEKVAAAIAQAAVQRPVEPKAYITAALQERVQPTDPYYKQLGQAVAKC